MIRTRTRRSVKYYECSHFAKIGSTLKLMWPVICEMHEHVVNSTIASLVLLAWCYF